MTKPAAPPPESDGHFVAHLKIEQVVPRSTPSDGGTYRADPKDARRVVTEVTQMTVKAPTLDALIVKLRAHVQVIGDLD